MEKQEKYIYHCDRCGEIFKSRVKPVGEMRCTVCGEPPVKSKFANVTEMPALEASVLDMNHGVAGKDVADFVSMKIRQKRRRAMIMYGLWLLLLGTIAGVGWYVKNITDNRAEETEALTGSALDHQRQTESAVKFCKRVFEIFSKSRKGSSRQVEQLVGGADNIVDMQRYYSNALNFISYKDAKIEKYRLTTDKGMRRLDAQYRLKSLKGEDRLFEVVFWEVSEDKWLMDWQHFVRFNEVNWSKYVLDKVLGDAYKFNLYVRRRKVDISADSPYQELLFSKAFNDSRQPDELESVVLVKKDTALLKSILFHIKAIENRKLDEDEIIGRMDPPDKARVHVVIKYQEVDGKQVMVLQELLDTDWMRSPSERKQQKSSGDSNGSKTNKEKPADAKSSEKTGEKADK